LTRVAETIIAEDSGALLRQHIAELKEDKSTLQHTVDNGVNDYNLLQVGNNSLLAERTDFKYNFEDLEK
jgi:FtsZ-binding cell division protein ZapB